jgi:hypothetical protein
MAIEKQNQTAPVVDDESPVPTQVPTRGQDDDTSEGTERATEHPDRGARRDDGEPTERRGERTGDRGKGRLDDVDDDAAERPAH